MRDFPACGWVRGGWWGPAQPWAGEKSRACRASGGETPQTTLGVLSTHPWVPFSSSITPSLVGTPQPRPQLVHFDSVRVGNP